MKLHVFTFSLLFSISACAFHGEEFDDVELHQVKVEPTSKYATGDISSELLRDDKNFFSHYEKETSKEDIELLKGIDKPITITSYFGLWCHDSQREIPQLLDLLDAANNPNITHRLIALDITKKEPKNRQELDGVLYTPTIIIKFEGQELGRIIEKPTLTLAKDIHGFVE